MATKDKILQFLRERTDFVSGQQLCGELAVSRTAVWKAVEKLREEGYPIEAVTGRGYRLLSMRTVDILSTAELEAFFEKEGALWTGAHITCLETIDSTNAEAFRLSDKGAGHGTLVAAGSQTAGRGRRGRTWLSPPDSNLYMSMLLKPDLPPDRAPMLTLAAALAVYRAVREVLEQEGAQCHVGIKWPNDIVAAPKRENHPDGARDTLMWKKVVGILTEMRMTDMEIRDVVIGIGINVNQTVFPSEIEETASSLYLLSGHKVNRAELAARVWRHFEPVYDRFMQTGDLCGLREEYEAALVNRGREVCVLDPREPYRGTALGITRSGELLVEPSDGSPVREVGTGEVSVRGVYGYV